MSKELKKEAESFPIVSPHEFRFIRENCGLTLAAFAQKIGKRSRTTPWNWEQGEEMKPYQIFILRKIVDRGLWDECRRRYKEMMEQWDNC